MRIAIVVTSASALLFVTTAHASTARRAAPPDPKPHAGAVKGGGFIAHSAYHADDDRHGTYEVVFATRATEAKELTVPIAVPAGKVVTGMTIEIAGQELVAVATANDEAHDAFSDAVQIMKDPALLEWKDASHVMLHVYPVTADEAAKVTMTFVAADTIEGHGAHLDKANSWIASPFYYGPGQQGRQHREIDPNDPYRDYWPSHY